MVNDWPELLKNEGIRLNSKLDFHCHNGGLRRVCHCGKEIPFSKESKLFARKWLFSNRREFFIVDATRLDGYDWNKAVVIPVSFLSGEPAGHSGFGNRKERKEMLKQIWKDSPYWEEHR